RPRRRRDPAQRSELFLPPRQGAPQGRGGGRLRRAEGRRADHLKLCSRSVQRPCRRCGRACRSRCCALVSTPFPEGAEMVGLAFVVAVVALVLAVVFFLQGQTAASAVKALREEVESSRKETEAARSELRKAQEELKARATLLSETREKLAETRRKAQEGRSGRPQARGAREAELEEDLAHARQLTEQAHAAETQARRDLERAKAAEAQL